MNYLSIEAVVNEARTFNFETGSRFDMEGILPPKESNDLKRFHGIYCAESVSMQGKLGPGVSIHTFEIGHPESLKVLELAAIMEDMPKLVYTPGSYVGRVTERTLAILNAIGFNCLYSEEECITVVAKRNQQ